MRYGEPQPWWHKLKYAIPTLGLFISPWMHLALYTNFMAAVPGEDPQTIHGIIWGVTGLVWLITFFWAVAP